MSQRPSIGSRLLLWLLNVQDQAMEDSCRKVIFLRLRLGARGCRFICNNLSGSVHTPKNLSLGCSSYPNSFSPRYGFSHHSRGNCSFLVLRNLR